jgi:hypothetical protein
MTTATARLARRSTRRLEKSTYGRPSAAGLTWLVLFLLVGFSFLPRVRGNIRMSVASWSATSLLALGFLAIRYRAAKDGRSLTYEVVAKKAHYIQLLMQMCIYLYWGYYWREVYRFAPMILVQVIFAYGLEMIFCWSRRDRFPLGLASVPLVLSTNFFLWFRDDYFVLQFLMIGVAVAGKEFITWRRDERRSHVFNPSAFALCLFSIGLLVTGSTRLTRGAEIAFTLAYPPHIYLAIFLVGLVVQALFSVTLVTLSAISTLCAMNVAYTSLTGAHQFVDSNIPVLVFLGAHLLVTDPATSPKTTAGKIAFGGLYGVSVFVLRSLLAVLGLPTFYDKLLGVPALNASVRALDRFGSSVTARLQRLLSDRIYRLLFANYTHMALWGLLFGAMLFRGFLHEAQGDRNPDALKAECFEKHGNACVEWVRALDVQCEYRKARACLILGNVLREGRIVPPDPWSAQQLFRRACELDQGCIQRAP